ncbi:hypothetical protein Btru_043563 [Bulinus truncatus]|nr:hypothetical protein Btru_043563 [Bulinus truncatus]
MCGIVTCVCVHFIDRLRQQLSCQNYRVEKSTKDIIAENLTKDIIASKLTKDIIASKLTKDIIASKLTKDIIASKLTKDIIASKLTKDIIASKLTKDIIASKLTKDIIASKLTKDIIASKLTKDIIASKLTKDIIASKLTKDIIASKLTKDITAANGAAVERSIIEYHVKYRFGSNGTVTDLKTTTVGNSTRWYNVDDKAVTELQMMFDNMFPAFRRFIDIDYEEIEVFVDPEHCLHESNTEILENYTRDFLLRETKGNNYKGKVLLQEFLLFSANNHFEKNSFASIFVFSNNVDLPDRFYKTIR